VALGNPDAKEQTKQSEQAGFDDVIASWCWGFYLSADRKMRHNITKIGVKT